jgi:hypothetical protein
MVKPSHAASPLLLLLLLQLLVLQGAPLLLLVLSCCCASCLASQGCLLSCSQVMRAAGSTHSSRLTRSRATGLIDLDSGAYAPRRIDLV